jgi:hypothetical protein
MKTRLKFLGFAGLALFFTACFVTPQRASAETKGQDLPGEKCQRNNKDGTTTTGQCSNVCKDLVVSGTKDVDSGLKTCKEARTAGGWGLVPVTGNPSILFMRYNKNGDVQSCGPTSKPDEIECRPVTIREAKSK